MPLSEPLCVAPLRQVDEDSGIWRVARKRGRVAPSPRRNSTRVPNQELYLLNKHRRHLCPKLRCARRRDSVGGHRFHETSIDTGAGGGRRLQVDKRKPFSRHVAASSAAVIIDRRDNHQAGIAGRDIGRVPSSRAAWIRDRMTPAQSIRKASPHVRRIAFIAWLRCQRVAECE
jgi:hypothetical protein